MIENRETKPWGHEDILLDAPAFLVKILHVRPHHQFSLQYHKERTEAWTVIKGRASVTLGKRIHLLTPGQGLKIHELTHHRLTNMEDEPLVVLELQLPIEGGKLSQDDIIRIEDDYGRVDGQANTD